MKTFEEKMNRLEEITRVLEKNEVSLDESIKLFEEGLKLSEELDTQLKTYQQKIIDLTEKGDNE